MYAITPKQESASVYKATIFMRMVHNLWPTIVSMGKLASLISVADRDISDAIFVNRRS